MTKVLIVEDDEVIASSMAQHLSGAGFDPITVGRGEVASLQRDAREQKMCQHGLAGKKRLIKEFGGTRAELLRFGVASLMESQEPLIQIEEPRPDEVFFLGEYLAGSRESLERLGSVSLLAAGDGFVRQRFRGLIAHAELLEKEDALASHFPRLLAEVQFEINF